MYVKVHLKLYKINVARHKKGHFEKRKIVAD